MTAAVAEQAGLPVRAPEPLDWAELLRTAAECGLLPRDFWGLSMREWYLYQQGVRRRLKWWHRLAAWIVAHIVNRIPSVSKGGRSAVTVEALMGERRGPDLWDPATSESPVPPEAREG